MAKVFLSHSSHDEPSVRRLADALRGAGHEPWLYEWYIPVGGYITQQVGEAVDSSDFVVVWLTKHSVKSGWVQREWQAKYHEEVSSGNICILPLLAEDCTIPTLLKDKLRVDFRGDFDRGLVHLLDSLEQLSGKGEDRGSVLSVSNAETLSRLMFPEITMKYCLSVFAKWIPSQLWWLRLPRFKCDAQVQVCRHDGIIKRHPNISSLGHDVRLHVGRVIWSSVSDAISRLPFDVLLKTKGCNGAISWVDRGYSQQYTPISSRSNTRVCIAVSHWTSTRVKILEMHHEMASDLEESLLLELGKLLGSRLSSLQEYAVLCP